MKTEAPKENPKCFCCDKRDIKWDKINAGFAMRQLKLCAPCAEWLRDIYDGLPDDFEPDENGPRKYLLKPLPAKEAPKVSETPKKAAPPIKDHHQRAANDGSLIE